jgi:plastocyanin
MKTYQCLSVLLALSVLGLTSCHQAGNSAPAPTYSHIDPATAGTIQGVIHFDKPAPKRVEIDMAQDPACSMTGGTNMSEEYVVNDGKMANVYVYVKSGLGDKVYPASTTPVVLDQKGCRYVPHVIAAQIGQPIEFRNSDATMHNVHMEPSVGGTNGSANKGFDISQPPNGGTTQHAFAYAENLIPVRCNNHPWMQAFINIAPNPFFAVSDAQGHYSITGLPPGTYTLEAVQEQLGAQQATVTVTSHGTTVSDFHYGVK